MSENKDIEKKAQEELYVPKEENKVRDFIKGFCYNIGIFSIAGIINFVSAFWNIIPGVFWTFTAIGGLGVETWYLVKFFQTRKYVAIGMIGAIILPLLLVGACTAIFSTFFALR